MKLSIGNLSKKMPIILMIATLLVVSILILIRQKEDTDKSERNTRQITPYSGFLQHDNHEPADADQKQSSPNALNKKIANWKQNQSALSEKIKELQSQIDAMAATSQNMADRTQDQASEKSTVLETDIENQEEENLSKIYEQIDLFENTIASEPGDLQWSDEAMNSIRNALGNSQDELNMELLEVDCRSTLCRMSFALDSSSPENGFERLQDNLPWDGEIFFEVDDMESGEAIVYIARQDHQLPKISQP